MRYNLLGQTGLYSCMALIWPLAKPFVTSVIIGAKTIEQLDDNIASTGRRGAKAPVKE